ncbi:hypothetical protein EK904_012793, partial [Melospiza melodia maxima]
GWKWGPRDSLRELGTGNCGAKGNRAENGIRAGEPGSEWKVLRQNSVLDKLLSKTCQPDRLVMLLEEACVMRDPFTPGKDKFLIIRSHCSLCSRAVCVGTNCSLFYSKSFCLPCVKENLKAFPLEIQEDMDKRKPQQKSCKKTDTKHKS